MNPQRVHSNFPLRRMTGTLAILLLSFSAGRADDKKVAPPVKAPAAAKAAPAKPASAIPGHPAIGGATAGHPAGVAPRTTGVTTANPRPSATTANPRPSATTANPHPTTTTANPRATTSPTTRPGEGTTQTKTPGSTVPGRTPVAGAGRQPQTHEVTTKGGNTARVSTNGQVRDIHVKGSNMDVHRNLGGGSRTVVERRDGRIVAERGGRSFVEHRYNYGGHEYGRRSYYYNGRVYDRYYRGYNYRGVYVEGYAPPYYYPPSYYGWVYNPWRAPISYAWGWQAQPWYGYYGAYFTPYPVYSSPSLWLTDYMISQTLVASYQAQQANALLAASAPPPAAPLTPDVKNLIAEEVRSQVALENEEAGKTAANQELDPSRSGIGLMLSDGNKHIFVAGRNIDVVDATGLECAVTQGDVLQLPAPPPGAATAADLVVLAGKGDPDCHPGSVISVAFDEIQEMQNHMRETIDQGMSTMHDQAGNGFPTLPPSAQGAPVKSAFAAAAPPADPQVSEEVDQQLKEADAAQRDLPGGTASPAPAPPAPVTQTREIKLGMSPDEVRAAFGQPTSLRDLGSKKVFVYPDMKVTFTKDKVTGVD